MRFRLFPSLFQVILVIPSDTYYAQNKAKIINLLYIGSNTDALNFINYWYQILPISDQECRFFIDFFVKPSILLSFYGINDEILSVVPT